MKVFLIGCMCLLSLNDLAQSSPTELAISSIEQMAERNPDESVGNESFNEYLNHCLTHPFDINTVDKDQLSSLMLLTDLQIESFISYRLLMGNFINPYELQSISYWDVYTIKKILPFLCFGKGLINSDDLYSLFKKGQHSIQMNFHQILEQSKGYKKDSIGFSAYLGSPLTTSFRYKYQYNQQLQYGLLGQKDAGEAFAIAKRKWGYDFYSLHFFVRNLAWIKALAIGDYTINMGQGLIQWQSLAFKKGGNVLSSKRASPVIKPYQSFGESNFHRGAAATIGNKKIDLSIFTSWRNLDANIVMDSTDALKLFISSYQSTGLHRTDAEWLDRHVQSQFAYGASVRFRFSKGDISANGIHFDWKYPLIKNQTPSNLFVWSGQRLSNFSLAYSYTHQNIHLFGETAIASSGTKLATVNGLLASVASNADLHIVYRNLSKSYASVQSNAFTESAVPTNEAGLYVGISLRPFYYFVLDGYADFYSNHWLKYGENRPSSGVEYFAKMTYRPSKTLEIYSYCRLSSKGGRILSTEENLYAGSVSDRQINWRTHLAYQFNRLTRIESRVEAVWCRNAYAAPQQGIVFLTDWRHQFLCIPLKLQVRLLYFEADGYDSRIYVFEKEATSNAIAVAHYRRGIRFGLQIQSTLFKTILCRFSFMRTRYLDGLPIGTGLDQLNKSYQSAVGIQFSYDF